MQITINFGNIVQELENKGLKLCFIANHIYVQDNHNNLYAMETYYVGSYLDELIRNSTVVNMHLLDTDVEEWRKEIWNTPEVAEFIQRQNI